MRVLRRGRRAHRGRRSVRRRGRSRVVHRAARRHRDDAGAGDGARAAGRAGLDARRARVAAAHAARGRTPIADRRLGGRAARRGLRGAVSRPDGRDRARAADRRSTPAAVARRAGARRLDATTARASSATARSATATSSRRPAPAGGARDRAAAAGAASSARSRPRSRTAPSSRTPSSRSTSARPDVELARDRREAAHELTPGRTRMRDAARATRTSTRSSALEAASFTNPWTREMLARELSNSDVTRVYVLRDAGPAGCSAFCACWVIFDELHINTLAVAADRRRRGTGDAAARRRVRRGRRRGRAPGDARGARVEHAALWPLRTARLSRSRPSGPRYYTPPEEDALILWRDNLPARLDTSSLKGVTACGTLRHMNVLRG